MYIYIYIYICIHCLFIHTHAYIYSWPSTGAPMAATPPALGGRRARRPTGSVPAPLVEFSLV